MTSNSHAPSAPDDATLFDIAIVGGGPAGLSAAIWSARYRHSVVLIDSGDPRNWETRGINGYLGLPDIRPAQLRANGRAECEKHGVQLIDDSVVRAERESEGTLLLYRESGDRVRARRLLLAIGLRDVWPDIPNLDKVYGADAHVCPDCDGFEASGKRVVVVGCGRRAAGMALALSTWTNDIVICTNGRPSQMRDAELQEKLAMAGIAVRTERVKELGRRGRNMTHLLLENEERVDADKLFFTIAQYPADDLGVQLGCKRDRGGHIIVSRHMATSVESVFAAGDITPGPQLAMRAASGGAVAALAMHKSLVPGARKLERKVVAQRE